MEATLLELRTAHPSWAVLTLWRPLQDQGRRPRADELKAAVQDRPIAAFRLDGLPEPTNQNDGNPVGHHAGPARR